MKKSASKSAQRSSSADDAAALTAKRARIREKRDREENARLAHEASQQDTQGTVDVVDERGTNLTPRPVKYVGPYAVGQKVRVRAKAKGYYGLRLWEPGQVFHYTVGPSGALMSWMTEEKTRERAEKVFEQEQDDGADEDVI